MYSAMFYKSNQKSQAMSAFPNFYSKKDICSIFLSTDIWSNATKKELEALQAFCVLMKIFF